MLDHTGGVGADTLKGLDALFCEDAVRAIAEWTMPSGLPAGRNRDDRWRVASSLQKAIRRGDMLAAMKAAHLGHGIDAPYFLKRLVVIAVEDVMLGNLRAVAWTLALAGHSASRKVGGEAKTLVWLAAQLASGCRDRSACNLVVAVDLDRSLHGLMQAWAGLPGQQLAEAASDLSRPIAERMLAGWLLAGTRRFWNLNVPRWNDRPRWELMALMVKCRMPLLLYYIADRAAIRGGGCMFVSLLPIWQEMQGDALDIQIDDSPIPTDPGLGALLSAAYDMHTREGQAALKRFGKLAGVEHALKAVAPSGDRIGTLFEAAFIVEGGRLASRISTPELDAIDERAKFLQLEYYGLFDPSDQSILLGSVAKNLALLHDLRRDELRLRRPIAKDEEAGL